MCVLLPVFDSGCVVTQHTFFLHSNIPEYVDPLLHSEDPELILIS